MVCPGAKNRKVINVVDFNIHVDIENDSFKNNFITLLELVGFFIQLTHSFNQNANLVMIYRLINHTRYCYPLKKENSQIAEVCPLL